MQPALLSTPLQSTRQLSVFSFNESASGSFTEGYMGLKRKSMFLFILWLNYTHKFWVFSEHTFSEKDVAIPENRSVSLKVTTWRHAQCLQLFKSRHCLSVPSLLAAWLSSSQWNYSDSCCCCPTKARNSMIVSWLPLEVCLTRIVASQGVIASWVPLDCLFKIIWQLHAHQFIVYVDQLLWIAAV